jgi:PAS domain S-box-containing protein
VSELEPAQLAAVNAVLGLSARHATLLSPGAFRELCEVVSSVVPVARMSVVLIEGPEHGRLYVAAGGEAPVVPVGTRFSGTGPEWHRVTVSGEPYLCHDTRRGRGLDPAFAAAGLLSYVTMPIRDEGEGRTVAELFVFFARPGMAAEAPLAFFAEVARVVGDGLRRTVALARDRRLAMILETSGDAMLAWDAEGVVTDANAAAARLTGRTRSELVGTQIGELLGPLEGAASATPGGRMALSARGGPVPVAATITAVEGDPLVASHALLRDVSDVVRAERDAAESLARVRELEQQHRTLLDNAPSVIVRLDPASGELDYLNHRAEELFGVPTSEALATPGFLRSAHADPEGAPAYDAALARAKQGLAAVPYEARMQTRRGPAVMTLVTLYPLRGERGQVTAIEGTIKDVSAEHAARTRLVSSDRLAMLGTLAAGIAHEINNPAAFILLGLDLLDRTLRGGGASLDEATASTVASLGVELRDSIRRIVDITRDLRLFASSASGVEGRDAVVDVNRTVESALSLTRGKIIERARLERDLSDVPPVVMPDGRLGQVVVNLLLNAAQAIPKTVSRENHEITVQTRTDGRVVEIEVRDTGVGIPRESLARIWQPFFSTKPPEAGTGLGLSICRDIVERAGGVITAQSPAPGTDPPRGARFVVVLPAAVAGSEPPPVSAGPGSRGAEGPARVLLVEDEAALARALAEELGRVHEVVVAPDAAAALELLSREPFDAVLCDLHMPGMSGAAFYAEVRRRDEALARGFVFMTGVGFGAEVERFLAEAGRPVLEKPFATEDALAALAKALRASRRRG